ncbi:MAG: hypothetical protein RL328_363, partial [Acidobacteriota bacterium]
AQDPATPPVITASVAPTVAAPKEPAPPARPKPQVTAPQPAAPKAEPAPAPAAPSDPASANAHYQRGRELVFQDKHSEGRAELREALRLDPRNAVLYNTLGFSYYATKDYKQAIDMFDQAIQINPNYLNATRNRALAKRGMGDMKGYEADHRRELELSRAEKNKKR